ncbi:antitoxin Xre/MbcA/ParS toxin-binding domain-containing protein [Parapedobacter sp. 10938]|uniref:antitoxin Xre/MbcA/ParS toxin-binding domain-containing protein n=1 Tax=Parapedobacter flavus TaxID=3110225 RepID=UPI002DBAF490|nr:antitoxin Xre/MbcA/ParS toxin-binding domain-containing protein [Parapedobacter sp. 10938]MEC3878128.1 antitoxin Xre/MbcA/ParS toxin-binding domain-containing protein [Parapedobacter sp. 10938]
MSAIGTSIKKAFKSLKTESDAAIFFAARNGIPPTVFYRFAKASQLAEKELARLINLSARTVGNYLERQQPLARVESEHLLKLIALYEKGEALFGGVGEFNQWLRKPFWNRDDRPVDWLDTPSGVDLVIDELDRIAHGYVI